MSETSIVDDIVAAVIGFAPSPVSYVKVCEFMDYRRSDPKIQVVDLR